MAVNTVTVVKLTHIGRGLFRVTLPEGVERYIKKIGLEQAAGEFPVVTISFVAQLETEDGRVPQVASQLIWRVPDLPDEEEE